MIVRQFAVVVLLIVPATVWADDLRSPIDPEGIRGTVVLCGRECAPDAIENAIEEAVVQNPLLNADRTAISLGKHPDLPRAFHLVKGKGQGIFRRIQGESVAGLWAASKGSLGDSVWLVWLHFDKPSPEDEFTATRFRNACAAIRDRGGVVILSGFAVPWLEDAQGAGILPGCRIATESREESAHSEADGRFLLRWNEKSLVTLHGRRLSVSRESEAGVEMVLPEGASRSRRVIPLEPGEVQDLTALRKAAQVRTQSPFPPEECPCPEVPRGTLMLVGGGLTDEMVQKFVECAGGAAAKIVIVPTAQQSPSLQPDEVIRFSRAGAGEVVVLHAATRDEATSDMFLRPLREATGVWFTGGRQWRLVDRYERTPLVDACREVLKREGVIGGTSAGATILGDYLVRGNPLGNAEIMAEGYERGFALLPGTAIDQHVTERGREPQLRLLNRTWPQLLTIGLDERTALVMQGTEGTVLGTGAVRLFDRRTAAESLPPVVLRSGESVRLSDIAMPSSPDRAGSK